MSSHHDDLELKEDEMEQTISCIDLEETGSQSSITSVSSSTSSENLSQEELPASSESSASLTPLDPAFEFHSLEALEGYVQGLAKSQGFKLHVTKHKNKTTGEYYRGKIDCCCHKNPLCPTNTKHTCTFWNEI